MSDTSTDLDAEFPWQTARAESVRAIPHLLIAWSAEEPGRVGEVAPIASASVLGRGAASESGDRERVAFFQQRPSGFEPQPPLESRRISREQLQLSPRADGGLDVRSIGRATLLVNGSAGSSAVLHAGDTLTLGDSVVFLVTQRPRRMPALRHLPSSETRFAFGEADRAGLVGESPQLWQLRDQIAFAARTREHLLVDGESGSGKELVARAVHTLSENADQPFLSRNAATFPEGLIDAELFGTAKDYPNAGMPRRAGLIADADGGTLFLDEIGELPAQLQSHLLRVLDRGGEYQRLGESTVQRADLRVVAATNRELSELKHDLVARLKLRISLPGLGEHLDDVPLLARHLGRRLLANDPALARRFAANESSAGVPTFEPRLVDALLRHRYEHHLRELERILLVALETSPGDYVALTSKVAAELDLNRTTVSQEPDREAVEHAIERAGGSATKAARLLGLKNRYALYRLAKKHGLTLGDET
jgi:two-component system nitrogen regulation response regulator GlnG/two-component system response regulator HydG